MVVIGSKYAVSQLPASGDFIDLNEIRMHSYDNVHQVLRKVPGVYVQEETGYGLLPNISLRGVDTHRSRKITLMEDGVLTAPAPYSAPSAYYSPTMGRMRGLEVLKGSSQVKYGPHTTGGAVNYLSTPIPHTGESYLKMLYGSFNEFVAHMYHGGMTDSDRFGGMAEMYHRRTDGFKTIRHSSGDDDQTGFDRSDYMVKLVWKSGEAGRQRFEVKAGYTDFEADETYLGLSEDDFSRDPYQRYYASRFDNFKGHHFRSYLKHSAELEDNLRITSTVYCNDFHRNWYKVHDIKDVQGLPAGTMPMAEALATGGAALSTLKGENAGIWRVRANNRDYYLWGIQAMVEASLDTAAAEHTFEAGLRYHTDQAKRFQWQDEVSIDDAGGVTAISPGEKGAAGDRVQTAKAIAAFVQDEVSRGIFTVIPGIRAEHIDNKVNDYNKGPGRLAGDEDVFAAGLATKCKLNEEALVFAGAYRGYSVPSPRDSIVKELEEETSTSGEIGARYAREGVAAQLSGFYTAFEDLIVGGYVGTTSDTDAENAGNVNSYGAELKFEIDPGLLYEWGFENPIWAAFTYTRATLDGNATSEDPESTFAGGTDGNEVPYIPECQVSVGYRLKFKKLDCDVVATYVDSVYSTANNSSEHVNPVTGKLDARFGKIDSRFVVNASTRYAVRNNVAAFVNVHNLLDEDYLASRHPHGPRPGQPLTAVAGIETSF